MRVKALKNLWLQYGKLHFIPVSTPKDSFLPSTKVHLDKNFQNEELKRKYKDTKENDIFSSLNCKMTEILISPEQKSVVTSLKRVSDSLMTCQKLYAKRFDRYEKKETQIFNEITFLKKNR